MGNFYDRYDVCSKETGLLQSFPKKNEANEYARQWLKREKMHHEDRGRNDYPRYLDIYDRFAKAGAEQLWRAELTDNGSVQIFFREFKKAVA